MLARWSLLSFFLALGGAAVAGDVADPAATPSSNAKDGGLSYETAPGESKPPLVNVNGRRVSVDKACQYYAGSDAVRQYTQMRDTTGFNANRQIELARWCRDHDLPEWANSSCRKMPRPANWPSNRWCQRP